MCIDWIRCSRFWRTLFSWPEYVLMTYQRNIREFLLEEELLHQRPESEISRVEVDAHDSAGDQDDHRRLDDLVLGRPFDLLQLAPRLADETGAWKLPLGGGRG